jgi:hypothetical protein
VLPAVPLDPAEPEPDPPLEPLPPEPPPLDPPPLDPPPAPTWIVTGAAIVMLPEKSRALAVSSHVPSGKETAASS